MDKNKYKFGMDWLNGVLPLADVNDVFQMLGIFSSKLKKERWQLTNSGKYNYSRRYCLDGQATIQLMYNPLDDYEGLYTADMNHNNSGIFFSISGDGIRYLHTLGGDVSALNKLLFYFFRNGFRASRFDVYCDILDEQNEIVPLITEAFSYFGQEQVGKLAVSTKVQHKRKNVTQYRGLNDDCSEFWNTTLGNHSTRFGMFRCYNKLVELVDGRLADFSSDILSSYNVSDYWYRLEYELHKENARDCFNSMMFNAVQDNKPLSFESVFFAAFNRVFRIVKPTTYSDSRNIGNVDSVPIWSEFGDELLEDSIHFVEFKPVPYVKCSLSRLDKNMNRISSYVYIVLMRLFSMSPGERRQYLEDASDKFNGNKRYNLIRDEFEELSFFDSDAARNIERFSRYASF